MSTNSFAGAPDTFEPTPEFICSEVPFPTETDGQNPELCLYRARTMAMLKAYFRFSIEVGRLPSILGREFFRAKVTSYRMASFEDAVIFVHDVESRSNVWLFFISN